MLSVKGLWKIFNRGTPDEKVALRGVHFSMNEGDFVTIIGSNGAGKSTLLNLISGTLVPDEGVVEIDGVPMNRIPEHARGKFIGRVFQDPMAGTAPAMTVEENLAIAWCRDKRRTFRKGVNRKRRALFREMLAELGLGLENRLTAKVGLLSGGERQALSLVMATFTRPRVLLLDEHTAALDPARADLIARLTKELVERHRLTTLMITHNMQQAIELGNRLIMMDSGSLVFEASEEAKKHLTVQQLIDEFAKIRGGRLFSDRSVLV